MNNEQTKLIKVGANTFEYLLFKNNEPTLVFLNGFRMPLHTWEKVYTNLDTTSQVFLYNRLGVGKSSKATKPQTGNIVVEDLNSLLKTLKVKPPYLLVSHSLGGIYANLFAHTFPNETAGLIFVESSNPDEIEEHKKLKPSFILQTIFNGLRKIEKLFDYYKYSENECIKTTIEQIKNKGTHLPVPIAVITGTKKMPFVPTESFDIHLRFQKELPKLSTNSKQYFCENSGHFPQITQPDVIVSVITEFISATQATK